MLLSRLGYSLRGTTLPRRLVVLVPAVRRFAAGAAPPPPPPPPPPSSPPPSEQQYEFTGGRKKVDWRREFFNFWRRPFGILSTAFVVLGSYYTYTFFAGLYTRYSTGTAEANAMNALQMEGSDPAQLAMLFLHAKLARPVLADEAVVQHMGTLRFQPETLKLTQLTKENKVMVTFNVYGTRRVGIVTAILDRFPNRDGLVVYHPVELTVDSWDGRVFDLSAKSENYRIDFTEARDEVERRKAQLKDTGKTTSTFF